MNIKIIIVFLISYILSGFCLAETTEELELYKFIPSKDVMADVDKTLTLAINNNKNLLIVVGAQWCHDSRSLAKQFSTQPLDSILMSKYEILFVDAGYLSKGFDVVKHFGLPTYYGTPTVMIIDPISEKVLNKNTITTWLSADSKNTDDYTHYFQQKEFTSRSTEVNLSKTMQAYMAKIEQFEQQQAIKLKKGYEVAGPLLEAYKQQGDGKASEEFKKKWGEVRKFRMQVPKDIIQLIEQAKILSESKTSTPLIFPEYDKFSWEK